MQNTFHACRNAGNMQAMQYGGLLPRLRVKACPWNMIVYNEEADTYSKCDLCGGDPQCVKYCPADAIKFIELR